MSDTQHLAAMSPRRNNRRAATWWGAAWLRTVEELAYEPSDVQKARAFARKGGVGETGVCEGSVVATAADEDGFTPTVSIDPWDDATRRSFVDAVRSHPGYLAALVDGELPDGLVEYADEIGAEILPGVADLSSTCGCEPWVDPCIHALAVMLQLTWRFEADPLLLIAVRGLAREDLMAAMAIDTAPEGDINMEIGVDAALRARELVTNLGV